MTAAPLLEARALCKTFDHEGTRIDVLRDVDLTVQRGEQVAILGRSGAGKSTLLHLLGTLDAPSSGTVIIDGTDTSTLSARALAAFRNRTIGFMFQFHHLLPEFTAEENVAMPALIRRTGRAEAMKQARALLEQVGLSHRLTHRPGELSGGEQQRVALARAIVLRPRLLLADEPTGNLDTKTSDDIHELFTQMQVEHGMTLLVVTHNPELASRMPRRLRMADGRLVDDTTGVETGAGTGAASGAEREDVA